MTHVTAHCSLRAFYEQPPSPVLWRYGRRSILSSYKPLRLTFLGHSHTLAISKSDRLHLVWAAKGTRGSDWSKNESADFPTNRSSNPHWPPEPIRRQEPHTFTLHRAFPSLTVHQLVRSLNIATPTTLRHRSQALRDHQHYTFQPGPPHSVRGLRAGQGLEARGRHSFGHQSYIQGERGSQRFAHSLGLVFHLMPWDPRLACLHSTLSLCEPRQFLTSGNRPIPNIHIFIQSSQACLRIHPSSMAPSP